MLKSKIIAGFNNNWNFLSCSIFLTILFSGTQSAFAQLRLGTGVQPGLEGHLLEYQQQGKPLSNLRGIQGCSVGFGTTCNKTAALLEKIILENSGMTRQDLILKASGGLDNYQKFTKYYPNHTDISALTSDSFWINASPYILDRYEYSGIGILEETKSQELYQVVSQFNSTSVTQNTNSLNRREGIIGLKTAYGRTLLEEARKIPNIETKIAKYGLNSVETAFHLQQFRYGVATLESKNVQSTNLALYQILSNPYTDTPGEFNRPSLNVDPKLDTLDGNTLEGDSYIQSVVEGEANTIALFNNPDVIVSLGENGDTVLYGILGGIGFTLLIVALASLDSNSSGSTTIAQSSGGLSSPDSTTPTIEDLNIPGILPEIITQEPGGNPSDGNRVDISEPSSNAYMLIIIFLILFVLSRTLKPSL